MQKKCTKNFDLPNQDKEQMAEVFAETWEKHKIQIATQKNFRKLKRKTESQPLIVESANNEKYNGIVSEFFLRPQWHTYYERTKEARSKCNSNSEGPDGVYYCMVKQLNQNALKELLILYTSNKI